MAEEETFDLSAQLTSVFEKFGIAGFSGILFFETKGATVITASQPNKPRIQLRCGAVKQVLQAVADELFDMEVTREDKIIVNGNENS